MAASRDGVIVHSRGYGMANLEHGVPNRPDTVFHIASVSKQFTAASIGMLALEKRISLDEPILKFLPELPRVYAAITIGNLVHHTSGMRDFSDLMDLSGWRYYQDLVTTEDAMSVLEKQRTLLFEPGSRYSYNNSNYLLMGEIVHRVTGQSLREFTAERIFQPLGMRRTHFRDRFAEVVANFAAGYERSGDTFVTSLSQFSTVGYSSLLTTVEDLMKWEENFYTGKVGGKALIDLMLTHPPLSDGKPNDYAFGIVVDEHRGLPSVEHSGGDAGYATHLIRFPAQHLSVAVLCNINSADPAELAIKTAEIYLGLTPLPREKPAAAAPAPYFTVSAQDQLAYTGRYRSSEIDAPFRVLASDGQLILRSIKFKSVLRPIGRDLFTSASGNILFTRNAAGAVAGFRFGDRDAPLAVFERYGDTQE